MIQIIYTGTVDEELLDDYTKFANDIENGLFDIFKKSNFIAVGMDSNYSQHLPTGKRHFTMFLSCIPKPQNENDNDIPHATSG